MPGKGPYGHNSPVKKGRSRPKFCLSLHMIMISFRQII